MNKFTIFSKELHNTTPWVTAMAEREAKKTPTYEMQQRRLQLPATIIEPRTEPILARVSKGVIDRLEEIKADLADLPLQHAL